MTKVFIADQIPSKAVEKLQSAGLSVNIHDSEQGLITHEELENAVKDSDFLITTLSTKVDESIITAAIKLKVIANFGAGFNNIDTKAASAHHILVTNTPVVSTNSVAEVTLGLILAISHRIVEGDRLMHHQGFSGWSPLFFLGHELAGKTLGVIGMGHIGRDVAKKAQAFSMNVQYWQPEQFRLPRDEENRLNIRFAEFTDLLQTSDFITLHAPLTEENHHQLDAKAFQQMKSSAFLINAARGPIVDEAALASALKNHEIAGAALDVYEHEPTATPELKSMNNVILTPHIGNATAEARDSMAEICANNILDFLAGKSIQSVN